MGKESSKSSTSVAKVGFKPQQERSKQTVKKILNVAEDLFYEHGVPDVSLAQIARAAGLPTATVYRYFPNKEDLLAQEMFKKLGEMLQVAQERLDEARNIHEFTEAYTAVLWDSYEEIQEHPFLHEAFVVLMSARSQKEALQNQNEKWADMFFTVGRRFVEYDSDEHLRLRMRVLGETWNGVTRLAQSVDRKDGDLLMKEAIRIMCRELGLPLA